MEDNNVNTETPIIEQKPKKKGTGIFIVLLILLVLGLGGYICYDKLYRKEPAKTEKKSNKKEGQQVDNNEDKDEYTPSNLTTTELEEILDERLPRGLCMEFSDLYQENGFDIKDLDDGSIIDWISLMINNELEWTEKDLTIDYIQQKVDNYILDGPKMSVEKLKENSTVIDKNREECKQNGNFSYMECDYDYSLGLAYYSIINNNKIKYAPVVTGCDDGISFEKKIINASESDNELKVDLKVAFSEADESPTIYLKQAYVLTKYDQMDYPDYATEKIIKKDDVDSDFDINWDLYSTYRMTFIKKQGNYYLDNVKLTDRK